MAIYANEQNIRKTVVNIINEYGIEGLVQYLKNLEARLDLLENPPQEIKPKRGRPRKVVNG